MNKIISVLIPFFILFCFRLSAKTEINLSSLDSLLKIQNSEIDYLKKKLVNQDSTIKAQVSEMSHLNNLLVYQDSILKVQQKHFELNKNSISKIKISDLDSTVQVIAVIVAILTILFAILLAFLTYFNYNKTKDVETTIKNSNEHLQKYEEKSNSLFQYYESKYEKKSIELDKNLITFKQKIKKDYDEFELKSQSRLKNIEKFSKEVNENKKTVSNINIEITSQKSYLKESVELIFDLFFYLTNNLKNKKLYNEIFIKRTISLLYSFDEKERFAGITTLIAVGRQSEIKHLERILLNKNESKNNVLLANNAITDIKLRSKG